ncbi:MAG: cellulase family glycosylhydrolase, partial [Segetibacter sp.]|nr:cellulase family glycosylhydrolase [Segetibacter sp.]
METMHAYLKKLTQNGGNFARVWVCNRLFEVEEKYGEYSEQKAKNVDQLLEWAVRYNIKLKLCLDNTRQIIPDEKAWFNKPQYHVDNGGPFKNVDEYINTEKGRKAFLNRIDFYSKRYGSHPAVFGWELWNEMNGIMCKGLREWNDYMLPEVHKRFPQNLVLQSLGSFDMESRRPDYSYINKLPSNDIAQIHRYIDAGAKLDVCTAPMDILSADAINELRSYHFHKPMLLAEVGAVLPNHTGPSELYPLDKEGALMHDMLFA